MRRRAFTTLEMILALAVASLVALAAVGVLTGLYSADERLSVRAAEQAGLGRAQIAIRRALTSLALSGETGPAPRGEVDDPLREDFRAGRTPRVALEADPLAPGFQRLLLAVHRAPVDRELSAALRTPSEALDRMAAVSAFGAGTTPEFEVGAFVFRPEVRDDLEVFGVDAPEITYTLWWTPGLDARSVYPPAPPSDDNRPRAEVAEGRSVDGDDDGDGRADATPRRDQPATFTPRPVDRLALRNPASAGGAPLVRGVTEARWRFYHRRAFKERMLIVRDDDLPAFVELELRTATGLYASWLFELDYALMDEPAPEARNIDTDNDEDAGDDQNATPDEDALPGVGDDDDPRDGRRTR